MPKTVDSERFVQLLRVYLTKTGRKQAELARASSVTESMVSKVLKGKAQPNPENFCKFQAAFLVAHGGITQARQVTQMAALLGRDLDEADLLAMAKAVERYKDPEVDTITFRDRAEAFRATIPAVLNTTENDASAALALAEPFVAMAGQAVDVENDEAAPDEGVELSRTVPTDVPAALTAWQAVLRDLKPAERPEMLSPDEVIAAVLDWESRQPDPQIAATVWNFFGSPEAIEPFRQRARLDFVLQRLGTEITWNQLEWQWLNHVLVETAQRQAGGAQLSPSQLAAFVIDLGQVAFEAVMADTQLGASLAINLAELADRLPIAHVTSWNWLSHIAQTGLVQLSVSPDGMCRFASREEAEFLAAQYVVSSRADGVLLGIARNGGRPFGVLTQAVRTLHYTGRDAVVGELVGALLKVSEDLPLRHADAAYLLAACEAPASPVLSPLWNQVQVTLCESWTQVRAPAYRDYVARAMRRQDCPEFVRMLRDTLRAEMSSGEHDPTTLRSRAIVGGPKAVESFQSLGEAQWLTASERHVEQGQPWNPLFAVLAAVPELAPSEQVEVLESLALGNVENDERWRPVKALAECGTIPAIRALNQIAAAAPDPTLARYAQTQLTDMNSPADAVWIAHELDAAVAAGEPGRLKAQEHTATRLLWRIAHSERSSPVLSRALARVWANVDLADGVRIGAALGLIDGHAAPALDICLATLPLADRDGGSEAGILEHLLPALSSPAVAPRLWRLVDRAASLGQRAILVRCLGRAGALALDEHFEQFLAEPSEAVAGAAVAALADALGTAAAERLAQVAAGDSRSGVRTVAGESLATIGSALALPYLREKLKDPELYSEGCRQLARLHHPEAEAFLVLAARANTEEIDQQFLYLPALAQSGGALAVQALRELLGPEPDERRLGKLQAELAADTAARASTVWERLAADASPAWGQMAIEVLVKDPRQTGIETVVRVAAEGTDRIVREHARNRLQQDVLKINSQVVTEYVLTRLEQQVDQNGQPSAFLLGILGKCLSGLSAGGQGMPPDIARRALALLWYLLSRVRLADDCIDPLLDALAFREFGQAAGELERWLNTIKDVPTKVHILDTLIAMDAPSLPDVVFRWAASDRIPELRARASEYLAKNANIIALAQFPNALKDIAYRIAIQKGIRFLRSGLRHQVILANGSVATQPQNP